MENGKKIQTFRDLAAWQRAMDLAKCLYMVTKQMPDAERFGLTNQMRRAVVSIPSNIAEGYARQSLIDYLRFLRTSRGSLAELSTQVELATDMKMIPANPRLQSLLEETDRILQFLIMSLEKRRKSNESQ